MNDFQRKDINERVHDCAVTLRVLRTGRDPAEDELDAVSRQVATEMAVERLTHGRTVSMMFYRVFGVTYTRMKAEEGDAEFAGYLRELLELPQTEPEYGSSMSDKEYAALLAECDANGGLCLEYYRRHPDALPNRRRAVTRTRKEVIV